MWRWRVMDIQGVEYKGEIYALGEEFEAAPAEINELGLRRYLDKLGPVEEA